MLSEKILWIVPILSFIGSARYIYDVARGKAKPIASRGCYGHWRRLLHSLLKSNKVLACNRS